MASRVDLNLDSIPSLIFSKEGLLSLHGAEMQAFLASPEGQACYQEAIQRGAASLSERKHYAKLFALLGEKELAKEVVKKTFTPDLFVGLLNERIAHLSKEAKAAVMPAPAQRGV